jgi:site-specific DNA-adenine methylase
MTRPVFTVQDKYGSSDEVTIIAHDDGSLHFAIDQPWAGDTETGFGQYSEFDMGSDESKKLIDFLKEHIK